MWKGGIKVGTKGYILTHRPNHHFTSSMGLVLYHRIVYESYHKCSLLPWAIIHHIDGNKLNNFPSNLKVMSKKQHDSVNMKNKWKAGIIKSRWD